MKKYITLILVIALTGLFSVEVFAGKHKRCGLGSKIFGKSKGVSSQVSEMGTNQISSEGSSMAYGTSGCKHDGHYLFKGFGKNDAEQLEYTDSNFEELLVQMSQGQGEYLAGFAVTLGCNQAVIPAFEAHTKSSYSDIVNTNNLTPAHILLKTKESISKNPHLSAACAGV